MNVICLIRSTQCGHWRLEIKLKNKVFVMLNTVDSAQLFKSQFDAVNFAQGLGFSEHNMKLM